MLCLVVSELDTQEFAKVWKEAPKVKQYTVYLPASTVLGTDVPRIVSHLKPQTLLPFVWAK